jgi:hypothetical protein
LNPVYDEYLRYLDDFCQLLEKMTQTAKEKGAAARVGDLVQVDACMKQEQAYSMSLRSMDQKRDRLHKAMGLEGATLSQVAGHFPQEKQREAARGAERALRLFEGYQSAANAVRTTMELALRDIEKMFPEDYGAPAPATSEEPPPRMKTDFRA